jgi:hypothetical protein
MTATRRRVATVFYEDRLATSKPDLFGPHVLMRACVADRLGRSPWDSELKSLLEPNPRKGNGNVMKQLELNGVGLLGYGPVLALLDRDRMHTLLGLAGGCCRGAILETMRRTVPDAVEIVLLDANVETLLDACQRAFGEPVLSAKPSPEGCDGILRKAAAAGDVAVRADVLGRVPSFKRLVDKVHDWVVSVIEPVITPAS